MDVQTAVQQSPTAVFRSRARTFSLAARFLPAESREAVTALYLFARTVDDIVDDLAPNIGVAQAGEMLDGWRLWLDAPCEREAPDASVAAALGPVLDRFNVPREYLHLLIEGVASDLGEVELKDWNELQTYCFRVASSVGLAMCHLLEAEQDRLAMESAVELGLAMQLTNILRDVGEDLRAGRVYLPASEMASFGYSGSRLRAMAWLTGVDDEFRALMRQQIARARGHYERGLDGVALLPPGAQLPILLAGRLYRGILDEIEAADYDVFSRRAVVPAKRKAAEIARAWVDVRMGMPRPVREPAPLQCPPWVAERYQWHG